MGRIPHSSLTTFPGALAWLATRPYFAVVQIGANVGNSPEDPLFPFLQRELVQLSGERLARTTVVLVEPVREHFESLTRAYAGVPCVRFENVAIAESSGVRDFYRLAVDPEAHGQPPWMRGLGSLRAERMTRLWDRHEQNGDQQRFYLQHRVVEQVQCTTLHDVVDRHALDGLDLLQIDAEGYDYEILKTIDFGRLRPSFINYERVLLQDDEPQCRAMLEEAGYALHDWGLDTLCLRTS